MTIGEISPKMEGRSDMPSICQFGGIRIVMFLRGKDHNPPHIHAFYQDFDASFEISTGELLSGTFPAKSKAQVKKFILQYQKELEEMWETGQYEKLPPIV